jgi:acetyl esterase/lipase
MASMRARGPARLLPLLLAGASAGGCAAPIEMQDILYDERFGDDTSLDLYLPDDGKTMRPAVMFIHGGAWSGGDKLEYLLAARRMGGSGYVAATINYRLVPGAVYPNAIQDVRCALAFLRAHAGEYGLDPDRVAAVGYSSGGHLASMLGVAEGVAELEPDCAAGTTGAANAVVAGAGIHDLRLMADTGSVEDFVGGSIDEVPDRYERASPVTHVKGGAPPYLLIHGGSDWVVSFEQSEQMKAALEAVGTTARFMELADQGHFIASGPDPGGEYVLTTTDRPESWIALIDFLYETLGAP